MSIWKCLCTIVPCNASQHWSNQISVRSSHSKVFYKKSVLKKFPISQKNTWVRDFFWLFFPAPFKRSNFNLLFYLQRLGKFHIFHMLLTTTYICFKLSIKSLSYLPITFQGSTSRPSDIFMVSVCTAQKWSFLF